MGIAEIQELPKRSRGVRKSKYQFTEQEVKQALKVFLKNGMVAAGPYQSDGKPLRVPRSAAQRLRKLLVEADTSGTLTEEGISTTAWANDEGEWLGLKIKE